MRFIWSENSYAKNQRQEIQIPYGMSYIMSQNDQEADVRRIFGDIPPIKIDDATIGHMRHFLSPKFRALKQK